MLAQVPEPTNWADWIDRFGWPGLIVVILLLISRNLWNWAKPHLDNWIAAKVATAKAEEERHRSVAESLQKLTDKTIEIQQSTLNSVTALKKELPKSCKWKPRTK